MNKLTYLLPLALFLAVFPSILIALETCQPKYFRTPKGNCVQKCGTIYKSGCSSGVRVCRKPCADGKSFDLASSECVDSCPPLKWQLYEDIVSICPSETVGGVVAGTIRFDTTREAFNANGGVSSFIETVTTSLQISKQQVRVTDVRDGSVIVDFEVVASGGDTTTQTLTNMASDLALAIDSGFFNTYGPVTDKIVSAVPEHEEAEEEEEQIQEEEEQEEQEEQEELEEQEGQEAEEEYEEIEELEMEFGQEAEEYEEIEELEMEFGQEAEEEYEEIEEVYEQS